MAYYLKKIINGNTTILFVCLLQLKFQIFLNKQKDSLLIDYDENRYPTLNELRNKILLRVKKAEHKKRQITIHL